MTIYIVDLCNMILCASKTVKQLFSITLTGVHIDELGRLFLRSAGVVSFDEVDWRLE